MQPFSSLFKPFYPTSGALQALKKPQNKTHNPSTFKDFKKACYRDTHASVEMAPMASHGAPYQHIICTNIYVWSSQLVLHRAAQVGCALMARSPFLLCVWHHIVRHHACSWCHTVILSFHDDVVSKTRVDTGVMLHKIQLMPDACGFHLRVVAPSLCVVLWFYLVMFQIVSAFIPPKTLFHPVCHLVWF